MKTVAIVSPTGGAGRSTVTAELASLLLARGHPVLALECDPRNVLGFHFGMRRAAGDGLGAYLGETPSAAWAQAGQRSDDGVLFLPWGAGGAGGAPARGGWLAPLLADVDLSVRGIALVDTPAWPSALASEAAAAADLVLVLVPPQPETCMTLAPLRHALAAGNKAARYVVTRLQPARQLHTDIVTLLRAALGGAMLPYQLHEDSGIPEALARSESHCRSAPHSQSAHDLQGLASWLSAWSRAVHASRGEGEP